MLAWCQGFLEVVDRKESMRADMWKARAHHVDIIARWTIPSGGSAAPRRRRWRTGAQPSESGIERKIFFFVFKN